MAIHQLKRIQILPLTVEQAWTFFSDPLNLGKMTPDNMHFRVLSNSASAGMFAGQIITYSIRPMWGIPVFWMTEITQVSPGQYFIDEQRRGPYGFWHHTHFFREVEGGVEMTDLVHYELPFGFLGDWIAGLVVKKKLEEIFDYRAQTLSRLFPSV